MTVATLAEVLQPALTGGYAVAGLVWGEEFSTCTMRGVVGDTTRSDTDLKM